MAEEKKITTWKGRIGRSVSYQQKMHKQWKDAIDLYNCDYFERVAGGFDMERVEVNFANWYINSLIPLLYFKDPYIFAKARNDQWSSFAQTMEDMINLKWRKLRLKQQFKRVIHSGLLMPPGWIKVGYTAKIDEDVAKDDENKQKGLVESLKQVIKGVIGKDEKLPEEQGILNMFIKEESVFSTWIPSWRILIPEGYHLISDMPYMIEIEDIALEDFKRNKLYKKDDSIKGTREVNTSDDGGNTIRTATYNKTPSKDKNDYEILRLFHIWDRRNQERLTVSMECAYPHFQGEWPYDMDGFPYKPLIFEETLPQEDKSNAYPPGILKSILPQLHELSLARTQMSKYRKRASAIIMADATASEEDMRQVEETEAVQIIKVKMKEAFQMMSTPPLPPTVFQVEEIINQDLQMATNMGQLMFQPMAGQRTATQAQIGQQGLQIKAQARIDVIEDFTVEVAMSLAQTLWQFYDRQKVAEELGMPVSPAMWPDLPKDKLERKRVIQSEIQFRIDAGSTAPPKDETVDRKQLLDYASIISTIAPERIKKDEFCKELTKRFKFVKDVDKIIISNDGAEQEAAMKENQLLGADVPQVVGPNENHELHVQVHSQIQHPTRASDIHLQEHAQFLGMNNPQGAQQGDTRPPMKSSNPEINRQGMTNQGDIYQSTQNVGVGTGPEAM